MCILFVHVNPQPEIGEYRLIIASNRDEYYQRPAKDVAKCERTGIIGGRDMLEGRENGMWLGINSHKQNQVKGLRFSALLNITGEKIANADGRGEIVKNSLECTDLSLEQYLEELKNNGKNYSGFNFVAVDLIENSAKLLHFGNKPIIQSQFSGQTTLGFGNSPVCSPLNKVLKGKRLFKEIIESSKTKDDLIKQLINLLKDKTQHLPDAELEKRAPEAVNLLSSIFVEVKPAKYGTRTHSVILVDKDWNIEFIEESLKQPIDIENFQWNVNVIKSNL